MSYSLVGDIKDGGGSVDGNPTDADVRTAESGAESGRLCLEPVVDVSAMWNFRHFWNDHDAGVGMSYCQLHHSGK